MACFDRLLQVTSQFSYADHVPAVSSSASDVLSNTAVAVIRDIAMLQMFMHV